MLSIASNAAVLWSSGWTDSIFGQRWFYSAFLTTLWLSAQDLQLSRACLRCRFFGSHPPTLSVSFPDLLIFFPLLRFAQIDQIEPMHAPHGCLYPRLDETLFAADGSRSNQLQSHYGHGGAVSLWTDISASDQGYQPDASEHTYGHCF